MRAGKGSPSEGSDSVSGSGQSLFDRVREAEISILGTILNTPETLPLISTRLKPGSFQHQKHRIIYRAMLELHGKGIPIDLLSLYELLTERGELEEVGGSMYLTYAVSVLDSEDLVRYEQAAGRILKLGNNGGTIKWEEGRFVYRKRSGEMIKIDY